MRSLIRLTAVGIVLASVSVEAKGQSTESTLLLRGDSITVRDYCRLARAVVASPAIIAAIGTNAGEVRANAAIICDPFLADFSLAALLGQKPASWKSVARLHTQGSSESRALVVEAMTQFRADVRENGEARAALRESLGTEITTQFILVSETAHGLLALEARDRALKRLARYERKLGPTSPKLNFIETGLNYAAQWIPGFGPTEIGGPSPLELVASYAPGYLAFVGDDTFNKTPTPVSASEFGLRFYLFGDRFGKSGWRGILLPSYAAAGMLTTSDENGALISPWKRPARSGGFVSWGAIKVGYVPDRKHGSWLVSKQFQALRFLF